MKYATGFVKEKIGDAEIAIVLGSGLGDLVEILEDKKVNSNLSSENRVLRYSFYASNFSHWAWEASLQRLDRRQKGSMLVWPRTYVRRV